jgi:hypothetical protein
VKDGDLSSLETMLLSQATTLQTMFASLARRAATPQKHCASETFMGLASQSRATIGAGGLEVPGRPCL